MNDGPEPLDDARARIQPTKVLCRRAPVVDINLRRATNQLLQVGNAAAAPQLGRDLIGDEDPEAVAKRLELRFDCPCTNEFVSAKKEVLPAVCTILSLKLKK